MREFIEQLINRIREFWEQLDLTRRLILLGSALAVVLLIIFAVFWLGRGEFVTLYAGLSPEDLGKAKVVLKQNGIDYKINEKYNEILVPMNKYDQAQILMAENGAISGDVSVFGSKTYKRGPSGYEILEKGSLSLMSEKEFEEFKRQALEGEIARTLISFEGVRNAKVGLALPESEIFVKDQKEPRASVLLTLKSDRFGDTKFVPSKILPVMQRIVAYRVPELKPENVQIADTEGKFDSAELAKEDMPAEVMLKRLNIEREYEKRFNQTIRQALQKYGKKIGSVQVRVKVDLNQKNILKEQFTPVTEDGEGLTRSSLEERESFEGKGILPGGVPGVSSNVPPEYMGTEAVGPSTYDRSKRIDNYEMNRKVTEEITEPTYEIVAASALVDLSLQPQVNSIRNIIAKTLNISDDKIAIEAIAFPVDEAIQVLKEGRPIWYRLIEMAIVALVVIAVLLFVRSMIREKEEEEEVTPIAGIPPGMTVGEYIEQKTGEGITDLRGRLKDFFERKVEREEGKKDLLERQRKRADRKIENVRGAIEKAKDTEGVDYTSDTLQKAENLLDDMEDAFEDEDYKKVIEIAPNALEAVGKIKAEAVKKVVDEEEQERRKQVFNKIKGIAEENPEAVSEIIKLWLQDSGESQSREQENETQRPAPGWLSER